MCSTCGCDGADAARLTLLAATDRTATDRTATDRTDAADHAHPHDHAHSPDHAHPHDHNHPHPHIDDHPPGSAQPRTVRLEERVLLKNDQMAEHNRAWLARRSVRTINLMSSPGSGKTTLLERTARELGAELGLSVIEGDQETVLDAERIRASGRPVVQINTGAGCHLDADMVRRGLAALDPPTGSLVVIENVGNLVCPALFDLGETGRVVVTSVTEGADKPLKYPHMFRAARLIVINKSDLLPYVDFDVAFFTDAVRGLNPQAEFVTVSARTGDRLADWYGWLRALDR